MPINIEITAEELQSWVNEEEILKVLIDSGMLDKEDNEKEISD